MVKLLRGIPPCWKVVDAEHWTGCSALHCQWWRLHLDKISSSGTLYKRQKTSVNRVKTNNLKILKVNRLFSQILWNDTSILEIPTFINQIFSLDPMILFSFSYTYINGPHENNNEIIWYAYVQVHYIYCIHLFYLHPICLHHQWANSRDSRAKFSFHYTSTWHNHVKIVYNCERATITQGKNIPVHSHSKWQRIAF